MVYFLVRLDPTVVCLEDYDIMISNLEDPWITSCHFLAYPNVLASSILFLNSASHIVDSSLAPYQ